MFNLNLYTVKERTPKNDEEIVLFGTRESCGMSYMEIPFNTVEYCWMELGDDGTDNGCQICYDESMPQPLFSRLMLLIDNGQELMEDDVYATVEDMDAIYEKIDELKNKD